MNRHSSIAGAEPLPRLSARELAYDSIRSGILNGDFPPGGYVEEAVACELTGVSRSPVREALNRLAAEGYVDLHRRRGAMVRAMSPAELRDLHEVRLMVETQAVIKICRERREIPDRLTALCDAHEATPATDHLSCLENNRQFHQAIVEAAGNTVLATVYEGLQAPLSRLAMLSLRKGFGKTEAIEHEHRALVAALSEHDEARALEIVHEHLSLMPQLARVLPG